MYMEIKHYSFPGGSAQQAFDLEAYLYPHQRLSAQVFLHSIFSVELTSYMKGFSLTECAFFKITFKKGFNSMIENSNKVWVNLLK